MLTICVSIYGKPGDVLAIGKYPPSGLYRTFLMWCSSNASHQHWKKPADTLEQHIRVVQDKSLEDETREQKKLEFRNELCREGTAQILGYDQKNINAISIYDSCTIQ